MRVPIILYFYFQESNHIPIKTFFNILVNEKRQNYFVFPTNVDGAHNFDL